MWKEWKHTDISYPKLNDIDIQKLREPLSDDEIKVAMFSMKPWKAAGPDGFPTGLYHKPWDILGHNVCKFRHGIWNNPGEIDFINQMDICLIPKIEYP